ncbi:LysR substrate-binding domain-containing protein [Inquilinus sp. CAU 1745]|uniref:LysR substrate-binding domain-containing protein n=1 Tax=Inquilinus sp. CAU 1745 TaxID=3140369 RepID=UPI00325B02F9
MTLKQLRYLVAVADARHFGRAAAACHISQPSLSAQIQQLESIVGGALFERTKRRVLPTLLGEAMAERARRVLAEIDRMAALSGSGTPLSGPFRLGVIPTLGPYLLPRILPGLRRAYPDLKLYLREDLTGRLVDLLRRGALEAALMALPAGDPGLSERPLFDEPFLLAAPEGHRLAEKNRIGQDDLAGEILLLLEDGHCFRDQALAACGQHGNPAADAFAATSLATLREMVAGGVGLTLLPALAANDRQDGVRLRHFDDPAPSRRIGLVCRKDCARAEEIALLGDHVAESLPEGVVAAAGVS